jgi:hypothetical protein
MAKISGKNLYTKTTIRVTDNCGPGFIEPVHETVVMYCATSLTPSSNRLRSVKSSKRYNFNTFETQFVE